MIGVHGASMRTSTVAFLVLLGSAGCTLVASGEPPRAVLSPGSAAPPAPVRTVGLAGGRTTTDTQVPFRASWRESGPPQSMGSMTRQSLVARFESSVALSTPVTILVRVPVGVRVIHGEQQYVINSILAGVAHESELVLEYTSAPNEDLLLIADVRGDGFGSHGEVPYRFGRSVVVAPVAPIGSPSFINGSNVGGAIVVGSP